MTYIFRLCYITMLEITIAQEWHRIFGVSNGGNFGIYELYTSSVSLNECNSSVTDLSINTLDHYKSKLMKIWNTLEITQIKLSIYKDGNEEAFLVFNGTGSNTLDWMDDERLINSSYSISDLQYPLNNYFSIYGHYGPTFVSRRFFINRSYSGCASDYGWMFVLDQYADVCSVDKRQNVTIYYSPHPTFSHYSDFKIADSLAVFIKGDSVPDYCCQVDGRNEPISITPSKAVLTSQPTNRPGTKGTTTLQTLEITDKYPSTSMTSHGAEAETTTTTTVSLESKLTHIKKTLTIDKNATILFQMSKQCADDPRYSAKVVGHTLGTGLLIFLGCLIILPDLQRAVLAVLTSTYIRNDIYD